MNTHYLPSYDKAGAVEEAISYTATTRTESDSLAKTFRPPKPVWADFSNSERRTSAMRIFAIGGAMEPEGVDVPTIETARKQTGLTDYTLREILKCLWDTRLLGWMPLDVCGRGGTDGGFTYRELEGHRRKRRSPAEVKAIRAKRNSP